jgi:SpoIID/LytB domain protein
MTPLSHRLLFWSRVVILALLVGFFGWSLIDSLLAERNPQLIGLLPVQGGPDPGIRVLLRDRAAKTRTHGQLKLVTLQAAILFTPDNVNNPEWQLTLDPQDEIVVRPHATGGFSLEHLRSARQLQWPVEHIRIAPLEQTSGEDGLSNPLNRDPRSFEAADRKAVIAVSERRYRGSLDVVRESARNMLAINILPLEGYIAGVVPAEMSPSYPVEALKAQAVCARSYAFAKQLARQLAREEGGSRRLYDLVDSVEDQAYHGDMVTSWEVQSAVHETAGQILSYQGMAFTPFYCASSGGRTANVEDVFTEARASDGRTTLGSVMQSVLDPYCEEGATTLFNQENSRWQNTFAIKPAEIRKLLIDFLRDLQVTNKKVGFIQDLKVVERRNERVARLLITTSDDDFELSGEEFRALVGPVELRSTLWSPDSPSAPDGDRSVYAFTTFGFGHGVGMSQVSAYIMAQKHGLLHRDILRFFYPGAELRTQW